MLLIVDDHEDTRESLLQLLKLEGYEVASACSGLEAQQFLKESKPELVILDFSMPDIDGLQVLREMKQDARLAVVPVIMYSAFAMGLRDKALKEGAAVFVTKGSADWPRMLKYISDHAGPPPKR